MIKLYALLLLFFSIPVSGQHIIKGKIIDMVNDEPLQYAIVSNGIKGSTIITDKQGYFQLAFTGKENILHVSLIGYRSQSIAVAILPYPLIIRLERGPVDLKEITITPQSNNASFHTISSIDLNLRPVNSAQDLLRLVPGLFLGEHHGGGIAEHIFVRGFDADHGTDVNVSVDDVPINLVSHAHGQGFSDLHFLIPELVKSYEFGKGPYYAEHGDFTTAGYVAFHTAGALEKNTVKLEGGQFNSGRLMAAVRLLTDKAGTKGQSAYIAGEANYTNGPFRFAQHFNRINLFGKYNLMLSAKNRLTVTASTFSSKWRSSGSIPERAVAAGITGRFGYIDSLQGGNTSKTNAIVKINTVLADKLIMENQVYYTRYHFDHHYNDTFFADDSINGDKLKQHEDRNIFGYNGKITRRDYFKNNADLSSAAGIGWQQNTIYNSELSHTAADYTVLKYIQLGNIQEMALNAYLDENLHAGKWTFNAGLRLDYLYFNYADRINPVMPSRTRVIASPAFNIEYTAGPTVQVYCKTGKGFHSNDARVVTGNLGRQILPAAYGAELGMNWKPVDHLFITAAAWYVYLQQEFVYDGDQGTLEPSGKTRRMGIDGSARYQFTKWLFGVADINISRARNIEAAKGNNYVPLAVPLSSAGGLDFKFANGFNGGISYRYIKNRPANEDNSLVAKGYFVNDLTLYYTKRRYETGLEIQNLFNVKWREEQFEVSSRLKNEPSPVDDINFTAGTSFFAKLKFAIFF